jgi:hypothetical protein
MKAFFIGMIILVLAGVGGYVYLTKTAKSPSANPQVFKTESITRTGILQTSNVSGVDYKHTITEGGKVYGVTSGLESLDKYVGKKVEATGQNSGTTLYIDTIKIIE